MTTALLVGATGAVGKHVLDKLLEDSTFTQVIVLARRELPISHPKLKFFQIDFSELDQFSFPNEIHSIDQMYFCYGSTLKKAGGKEAFIKAEWEISQKIFTLALRYRIHRLLLISAAGANVESLILYSEIKGKIENLVRTLGFKEVVVFRPSLLITEREEWRAGEFIAQKLTAPISTWLQKQFPKYAPISVQLLANAMVAWGKKVKIGETFLILENKEII